MRTLDDSESFAAFEVAPEQMDRLWAGGWRHFGWYFFRYRTAEHGDRVYHVTPLRIDLARFELSRSQKRVLGKNRDARVLVRPSALDDEREALFARHAVRFEEDAPSSLTTFVSPVPATVPCPNVEVAVEVDGRLVAVTYLDLGREATSAVYAIHEPELAWRSLGVFMMLASIRYSIDRGCRYYYHGYAYREPYSYDYKKRFAAVEVLDWDRGWSPQADQDR